MLWCKVLIVAGSVSHGVRKYRIIIAISSPGPQHSGPFVARHNKWINSDQQCDLSRHWAARRCPAAFTPRVRLSTGVSPNFAPVWTLSVLQPSSHTVPQCLSENHEVKPVVGGGVEDENWLIPRRQHQRKSTHLVAHLENFLNGDRKILDQIIPYFTQTKMPKWKVKKKNHNNCDIIKEEL